MNGVGRKELKARVEQEGSFEDVLWFNRVRQVYDVGLRVEATDNPLHDADIDRVGSEVGEESDEASHRRLLRAAKDFVAETTAASSSYTTLINVREARTWLEQQAELNAADRLIDEVRVDRIVQKDAGHFVGENSWN
jgi:hypothetical protein